MKLHFDSDTGVFTIKPETKEEITKLRMSALDIANRLVSYFDAEVREAKIDKPSDQKGA